MILEFAGKFDMGWDEYRKRTFDRQKQLGVIPQDTIRTPRPASLPAGSGRVEKTTPYKYWLSENQDIGTDTGTAVSGDYRAPFNFEGTLEEVVVNLKK